MCRVADENQAEQTAEETAGETSGETPKAQVSGLLPAVTREVEEFVAAAGWEQPPQLFALVSTSQLLAEQPELSEQLDEANPLTPVAQDQLPGTDLAEALAGIVWPDTVGGCALTQEIVVLPPDAEEKLESAGESGEPEDATRIRRVAAEHPQRREARLAAAAIREGDVACVLRLRETDDEPEQIVEHPELAPNLTAALLETLRP